MVSKADQVAHDRERQMRGEVAHRVEAVSPNQLLDQLFGGFLDQAANVLKSGGKKRLRRGTTNQAVAFAVRGGRISSQNLVRECTCGDALAADECIVIAERLGEDGVMDQGIIFMPRQPDHRPEISHRGIMRPRVLYRLVGENIDIIDRCLSHQLRPLLSPPPTSTVRI